MAKRVAILLKDKLLYLGFVAVLSNILIMGIASESFGRGRTYYVDFKYVGGMSGTSQKPFASLGSAVAVAEPGDTIFIKTGNYTLDSKSSANFQVSRFKPDSDGSNLDPSNMLTITVDPEGIGNVVIKGTGTFSNESLFNIHDSRCLRIDGDNRLIIDGSSATISKDQSLVSIYASAGPLEHVVFEKTELRNSSGRGISFHQLTNTMPANIFISNNLIHDIAHRAVGGFGNTIYIEGNRIWNAALSNRNQAYGGGGWPGVIQTARNYDSQSHSYSFSKNIFISNNSIYNCWGEGIIMNFTSNGLVKANTIRDVFSVYIYLDGSNNCTVDGNHLCRTTAEFDRKDKSPPQANGISFCTESYQWGSGQQSLTPENIMIRNNLVDNLGKGISYWHAAANSSKVNTYRNISICRNVLRNLHNTPIFIDAVPSGYDRPSNGQVKNNIIANAGMGHSMTFYVGDAAAWVLSNNNWTGGTVVFRDPYRKSCP